MCAQVQADSYRPMLHTFSQRQAGMVGGHDHLTVHSGELKGTAIHISGVVRTENGN